jgi:myo-inositol 2-dehydrogenase / D-chiro-inositol 1-dehydrogenase
VRIAVAGVGRIGAGHAALLAAHPDVSELLIADADAARAKDVAADLGARALESVDELFASDPDGLVVATASASHPELVERAASAGVTTFCEKPVALDSARTEALLRHVAAAGATVQVGFMRRFDPGYVAARRALLGGELGDLRRVHLVSGDPVPVPAAFVPTSGGIFRDFTVHDIDILRWISGREVVEVYATGANRGAAYFGGASDVDEAAALLTLDDGTLATAQTSRYNGAGYDIRMELAGTRATWVVGLSDRTPLTSAEPGARFPAGRPWDYFYERFRPSYAAELDAFVDLVAGSGANPCSITDALQAFVVADALELSRAERRPVRVVGHSG